MSDLGPILLTDYYHPDYYTIVENVMGTDPLTFVLSQFLVRFSRFADFCLGAIL